MLNIAICDDEQLWLDSTAALLEDYFARHAHVTVKLHTYQSAHALLEDTDTISFDLYILDVVMPQISGIQLGEKLRQARMRGLIIYLTTERDFALDAYCVHPFHYLIKPLQPHTLFAVLDKAMDILLGQRNRAVTVKTKDGVSRLLLDDILYVEFTDRCCRYHLSDGTDALTNQQRISFAEATLPLLKDDRFYRCGASFVVNLHHVKTVNKNQVHFRGQTAPVYLPKNAGAQLLSAWLDYWMKGDTQ